VEVRSRRRWVAGLGISFSLLCGDVSTSYGSESDQWSEGGREGGERERKETYGSLGSL